VGKIVISENVSVDGVIPDREDWFTRIGDKDREEWAKVGSRRRWAPRRCCWGDLPTRGSSRVAGHPVLAGGRTGCEACPSAGPSWGCLPGRDLVDRWLIRRSCRRTS
jgi:hypothetical protein